MSTSSTMAHCLTTEIVDQKWRLLDLAYNSGDLFLFKQLAKECDNGEGLATTLLSAHEGEKTVPVLHLAAAGGNTDICDYLVNQIKLDVNMRDEYGCTPLHHAAGAQHPSTVEFLISAGADISLSESDGLTALYMATATGNAEIVELLISKGADMNSLEGPSTALQLAATKGNKEVVEVLLRHKANPNLTGVHLFPPVFSSILAGSVECLELLLKAGGDPNINPGGFEPLIFTACMKQARMVECLLKYGADPNSTSSCGVTPLEYAALKNDLEIMRILLPVTAQIPSYLDWSINGILDHVHSGKMKKVPEENFLIFKGKGTEAFKTKNYHSALLWYTRAIMVNPFDWTLFSNRSLCWLHLSHGGDALADAIECVKLNPKWPKAHYRKGAAYKLLKNYKEAAEAFKMSLRLDPDNKEIDKELREVVKLVGRE